MERHVEQAVDTVRRLDIDRSDSSLCDQKNISLVDRRVDGATQGEGCERERDQRDGDRASN